MAVRIDAHQHFWQLSQPFDYRWLDQPEHAPIRRDFLPADLAPHLAATGMGHSVFVQTQHNVAETYWALGLAQQHDFIAGVVGWVDLASPDCEQQLRQLQEQPRFVGVRHLTQDEPEDDFLLRPEILRGLGVLQKQGVPFDLLLHVRHLGHVAALARQLPQLRMVIDHLAKPAIRAGRRDDWLPHLQAAAACDNVYCKLSGLITEASWKNWTAKDLAPYVQAALECFGPARCMFGSDWPVCELAGSYEQVHLALCEALGYLSPGEEEMIFGESARRFYQLAV
jgi:L-fuconolactonase